MADHWFEALADHMGEAYLRYSFTKGTVQEVDFLLSVLGIVPGQTVLDVGCGPGRHANELAARGFEVTGVDVSETFIEIARSHAPPTASFVHMDAATMHFDGEFDAVISICQGAFGLMGDTSGTGLSPVDPDAAVLGRMARALKPGGRMALTAFSSYFMVRDIEANDTFDASTGVNHEVTSVRDAKGEDLPADLWTSCFTPRELRLMARMSGLVVEDVWSVGPGAYGRNPPDVEHPEFLVLALRPDVAAG